MNLVIAGGGTGGHLFPGIAVYEKLISREGEVKAYLIGTKKGIENKLKNDYDFKFIPIDATGFIGKNIMNKMRFLKDFLKTFAQVRRIYRDIGPDFVLGLGGYASFMPLIVARLKGIRSGVMEQNISPGLAVKILSILGVTVFASFEETKKYLPFSNVVVTGNPVRENIMEQSLKDEATGMERYKDNSRKGFSIFVFGGSQGAASINKAFVNILKELDEEMIENITIFHQTGEKDYKFINEFYLGSRVKKYEVFPFSINIEDYYSRADLVVSRAGAGTISELIVMRKPAILIPYPFAANNHQEKNARIFSEKGCFWMVKDDENLPEILLQNIKKMFYNKKLMYDMYNNIKKIDFKDPALSIANIIFKS